MIDGENGSDQAQNACRSCAQEGQDRPNQLQQHGNDQQNDHNDGARTRIARTAPNISVGNKLERRIATTQHRDVRQKYKQNAQQRHRARYHVEHDCSDRLALRLDRGLRLIAAIVVVIIVGRLLTVLLLRVLRLHIFRLLIRRLTVLRLHALGLCICRLGVFRLRISDGSAWCFLKGCLVKVRRYQLRTATRAKLCSVKIIATAFFTKHVHSPRYFRILQQALPVAAKILYY